MKSIESTLEQIHYGQRPCCGLRHVSSSGGSSPCADASGNASAGDMRSFYDYCNHDGDPVAWNHHDVHIYDRNYPNNDDPRNGDYDSNIDKLQPNDDSHHNHDGHSDNLQSDDHGDTDNNCDVNSKRDHHGNGDDQCDGYRIDRYCCSYSHKWHDNDPLHNLLGFCDGYEDVDDYSHNNANRDLGDPHDNKRDDNDHVHRDESRAACFSAYSWFLVGIDLGGARARLTGCASDLSKSSGKQETLSVDRFSTLYAETRNSILEWRGARIHRSTASIGRSVDST
jgi:hypothetical protein